jgi:7,8-dihydropterin-6-yl-methyl-4-(beta-D-ribofuranosyl)aminobenzene 5'-phosphate synthase
MVVTSLMDDYCPVRRLHGEHGLSLLIEMSGARILFDTGQGPAFMDNAQALGLDLSGIDAVVLSHGHYDHGGGLFGLYERLGDSAPPLFAGKDFDGPRYSRGKDGLKEIGIPKPLLPPGAPRPITIAAMETLAPGIHIVPAAERVDGTPSPARFRRAGEAGEMADGFDDELSLVIETPDGLAVLAGCAHRGITNILAAALQAFPGSPLAAVIGGFHLVDASGDDLEAMAGTIAAFDPGLLACSHCTGLEGFAALSRAMPGRTRWLACGTTIEV